MAVETVNLLLQQNLLQRTNLVEQTSELLSGVIAPVGGNSATTASGVSSQAVVYSPTQGHIVVIAVSTGITLISALSVKDNLNNTLTPGPSISDGAQHITQIFYYTAPLGVTGFTASWTTNSGVSVWVEEYSGALGGVNPSGVTNQGNGTGPVTVSFISTENNSFIVGVLESDSSTTTPSMSSGTSRQVVTTNPMRGRLADNTAASAGTSVTLSATFIGAHAWQAAAIELLLS